MIRTESPAHKWRYLPMKIIYFLILSLIPFASQALEYKVEFENAEVRVSKIKMLPGEKVGPHRDECSRIVIGLKGGTYTRIEADGSFTKVSFPPGEAIFLPADPVGQLHSGENGDKELEIIVVELKTAGS